MSNVTLSIGGRNFTVACAAGEEDHVAELGRMIDTKVAGMGDTGTQNEARMLLFGALLLADELHEARHRGADVPPAVAPEVPGRPEVLGQIADRLENLAERLEDMVRNA